MKTVIDAVNEFNGEFNNGLFASTHHDNYLNDSYVHMIVTNEYSNIEIGSLVVYSSKESRNDVDFICTREEFNQCVLECSTNFGDSSLKHLELYQQGIPNSRSTIKPVYTQAMSDNGELPLVGVKCLVIGNDDDNYHECEIILHKKIDKAFTVAVFAIKNYNDLAYYYSHCTHRHFKPLTPPIELVDGKAYQFDVEGVSFLGFYQLERKSFFDSNHNGNKVCGKTRATNIKLLEVKS